MNDNKAINEIWFLCVNIIILLEILFQKLILLSLRINEVRLQNL